MKSDLTSASGPVRSSALTPDTWLAVEHAVAAVPDLLEALADVLAWLDATPEDHRTVPPDSIAHARAALAKAEGRTTGEGA